MSKKPLNRTQSLLLAKQIKELRRVDPGKYEEVKARLAEKKKSASLRSARDRLEDDVADFRREPIKSDPLLTLDDFVPSPATKRAERPTPLNMVPVDKEDYEKIATKSDIAYYHIDGTFVEGVKVVSNPRGKGMFSLRSKRSTYFIGHRNIDRLYRAVERKSLIDFKYMTQRLEEERTERKKLENVIRKFINASIVKRR